MATEEKSINPDDPDTHLANKLEKSKLTDQSSAEQHNSTIEQKEVDALKDAMKVQYFLIKKNLPYASLYNPVMMLCMDLGATNLQYLAQTKKATYRSPATAKEFLECQAEVVEKRIKNGIRNSGSYGVMIDEYTDVSRRKHLAIVCRYVDCNGSSKLAFLHDSSLENGKGETIYKAMKKYLESAEIPLENMTSFVSDGAPAMVGKNTGVVAFLRAKNESVLTMHCMNHRLQLAVSKAFSSSKVISKVDDLLNDLFFYYHSSTVHSASLRAIQQMLKENDELESQNILTVKRAVHSRWLSHEAAVQSVRKLYEPIILELDALEGHQQKEYRGIRGTITASNLLKMMKTYENLYFIHLLCDVCASLASLTKFLESEEVDLLTIEPKVLETISKLTDMKINDAKFTSRAESVAVHLEINVSDDSKLAINAARDQFIDQLITNITERMKNADLISHLSALNLAKVDQNCFTLHGNEEISSLAAHFQLEKSSTSEEWSQFKDFFKQHSTKHPKYLLETLAREKAEGRPWYPNIYKLLTIAETLVISTSAVERVFSKVQLTVTPHRNRLDVETVNKLLTVSLNTRSVDDLGLGEVVEHYLKKKNRRISTDKSKK